MQDAPAADLGIRPSFAGAQVHQATLIATLDAGRSRDPAVPDHPEPPFNAQALTSPSADDEASIRLLLDALVRRLKRQSLELAERTARQGRAP